MDLIVKNKEIISVSLRRKYARYRELTGHYYMVTEVLAEE